MAAVGSANGEAMPTGAAVTSDEGDADQFPAWGLR